MSRSVEAVSTPAGGAACGTGGAAVGRLRPNAKILGLLAIGHMTVDCMQGALPAILPALKSAHGLSYAAAGTIILLANLTSSVIQPVFGYLSDRTARRWLLPPAVLLAGAGLALTGVAPGYPAVLALVVLAGLGIAAYHPEGYKTASSVAGDRKATGVSWFSVGGNIGIAIGPPLVTMLLAGFGLAGTLGLAVPALLVALLLLRSQPAVSAATTAARKGSAASVAPTMPWAMAILVLVVMIRSWTQLGFTTFVPFYYVDYLKADPRLVGPLLFVFLGAGAVGTLVGGPMADRIGPRRFMVSAIVAAAPLGAAFFFTGGWVHFVVLGALGFVLVSTFTTSVVLAQAYLPRHLGMASGLIVGLAVGAGGIGASVLGWVADRWGLPAALWSAALMPAGGFVASLFLPEPKSR